MPVIQVSDLPSDLQSNAQVNLWVDGANAQAARIAPCLDDSDPAASDNQMAEARMVLVGAVARWAAAGAGAFSQVTTGPFGVTTDNRQRGGYRLWPSEIEQLQDICGGSASGVFAIDTISDGTYHADVCSANTYVDENGVIVYGAAYCTCGADIAGFPLYEVTP
jgi:hypothetical protein